MQEAGDEEAVLWMRKMAVSRVVLLVVVLMCLDSVVAQDKCPHAAINEQDIEACVNDIRLNPYAYSFHCSPPAKGGEFLVHDSTLQAAADRHAQDMADNRFFSHRGSDGSDIVTRALAAGFGGGTVGENLVHGYDTTFSAVESLMCSPSHRRNIQSCQFDSIAVSIRCNSEYCYIVQAFGCVGGACCFNSGGSVLGESVIGGLFGTGYSPPSSRPLPGEPCTGGFLQCLFGGILG